MGCLGRVFSGDGHRPRCVAARSSRLCVRTCMDVPDCELIAAAVPATTFEGFAGTGGGDGVRIRDEVTKSSKSSKDIDVDDLAEFSACVEDGELRDESMDSRGAGKGSVRGRVEKAENESSSSSS